MLSHIENPVKRQANIARAFERAVAEGVEVVPQGDPLTASAWLARSSHFPNTWYTVQMGRDADVGYAVGCTCKAGQKGIACKHQGAVEIAYRAEWKRRLRARIAEAKVKGVYSAWALGFLG